MKPLQEIFFSDFLLFLRKKAFLLLRVALLIGIGVYCLCSYLVPTKYVAEALFFEASPSSAVASKTLMDVLLDSSHEEKARGWFLSSFMLREVVKEWSLVVTTEAAAIKKLKKQIKIISDPFDPQLISICFAHPSKKIAGGVLNQLMSNYQTYLQSEKKRIFDQEMAFLDSHLNEERRQLNKVLAEQGAHMSDMSAQHKSLVASGELLVKTAQLEEIFTKLSALEMQETHLNHDQLVGMSFEALTNKKKAFEQEQIALQDSLPGLHFPRQAILSCFNGITKKGKIQHALYQESLLFDNRVVKEGKEQTLVGIRDRCKFFTGEKQRLAQLLFQLDSLLQDLKAGACLTVATSLELVDSGFSSVADELKQALSLIDHPSYQRSLDQTRFKEKLVKLVRDVEKKVKSRRSYFRERLEHATQREAKYRRMHLYLVEKELLFVHDAINEKKSGTLAQIRVEKQALTDTRDRIYAELNTLTPALIEEKRLELDLAIESKKVKKVTELIENKQISRHLNVANNRVIEKAQVSKAELPRFFLSLLSAFAATLIALMVALFLQLKIGFPLSLTHLRHAGAKAFPYKKLNLKKLINTLKKRSNIVVFSPKKEKLARHLFMREKSHFNKRELITVRQRCFGRVEGIEIKQGSSKQAFSGDKGSLQEAISLLHKAFDENEFVVIAIYIPFSDPLFDFFLPLTKEPIVILNHYENYSDIESIRDCGHEIDPLYVV